MALNSIRLRDAIVTKIEAITDFPRSGTSPIIRDKRVILAIAEAIVEEFVGNADVLPAGHSGPGFENPTGQPSTGADPQGGTVNSTTTAPASITGMGKVV